ncbi:MAG TPA: DUF3352 domain-containing protein [Bacteroidales bacterium]|nr:DUF3352 domain-containing protein [Bacteroidales bacterium]
MKKIILWSLVAVVVLGGGFLAWHFFSPYKKVELYSVIPAKPVFIIETDNSYQMWESLTESRVWGVLSKHSIFAQFGKGIATVDSMIQGNPQMARYIGRRNMMISMHLLQKDRYDFVYAVDLRRMSKLLPVKDFLTGFIKGYDVKTIDFSNNEIFQLKDKKNSAQIIYIAFLENVLVASFTQKLVESSITQFSDPLLAKNNNFLAVRDRIKGSGMLQLYINYAQVDDYINGMLVAPDPNLRQMSKSLYYSGLAFDITSDNLLTCEGVTNYNDSIASSFRAMIRSGKGKTDLLDVLPEQTASSVSLGFEKFTLYYDNVFANLSEVPKSYKENEATIKQVEKFLKIDVKKNIMDWIADEAAMVHLAPMGLGRSNEFAVFLKAKDIDDAKENLDFVMKQVKKRTPVKFQQVEYNGYYINYLSVKGFFKLLLGKYFQKLDKPYFTYIGDYVFFSNHPQTLKMIIDGVVKEKLLAEVEDYKPFSRNFSRKSNVLAVMHTEQFLKSIQGMVTPSTWAALESNKQYILCFPYFGFQMEADGQMFKTKILIQFNENRTSEIIEKAVLSDSLASADTTGEVSGEPIDKKVEKMLSDADEYFSDDPNAKVYRETYPNGQTKVEFQMRDGFRHGDYTEYYENGNTKISGKYSGDHKDGVWKIYDEDENLLKKIHYKDGKIK